MQSASDQVKASPAPMVEQAEEVIQADRDAAASLFHMIIGGVGGAKKMRAGEIDHHSVVQAFARHRLNTRPAPAETEGVERFADDVADVHSRIIIVHQLRASAEIQDRETKKTTGWADTNDRATLMRKAADTIERIASTPPADAGMLREALGGAGAVDAAVVECGDRPVAVR